MLEPVGLLNGADARAAVAAGVARWLYGGPQAFTAVRHGERVVPAAEAEAIWADEVVGLSAALPDWAGLGSGPLIMGIVNVTPDSFSDGGEQIDPAAAIAFGRQMLEDGADILDVGGESTRPGSLSTSSVVERGRVLPVIEALAKAGAVVSADTRNAGTMRRALDAGARIINDVTALQHDPDALSVVARAGCPVVLMHMRGTPVTMMALATYGDVAGEVFAELTTRVAAAETAGVARANIAIDPGFGFAKEHRDNLLLLLRLPLLLGLRCPIVAGLSRKATIGRLMREAEPKARGPGSVVAALYALERGARVVRVHDVRQTRQAIDVWQAMNGGGPE